ATSTMPSRRSRAISSPMPSASSAWAISKWTRPRQRTSTSSSDMTIRGLFALLLLALSGPPALAEYFTIRQYDVNVRITEEGYADFEEILRVEFTQPRHGIFRFVPYRDDIGGKRGDR